MTRVLAVVVAAAVALSACGSSGHGDTGASGTRAVPSLQGFNATAIYGRDTPGVVTVISVFGGPANGVHGSGFVITEIDGRALTLGNDLGDAVALLDPGQVVTLEVWRDGVAHRVRLMLGSRPAA